MFDYRIEDLFPDVERIEIEYHVEYVSAFGVFINDGTKICMPDMLPEFKVDCANIDCTGRGFNLHSQVVSMIAHKELFRRGKVACMGNEALDHPNSCPTMLEFVVRVVFRKDPPQ